MLIEPIYRRAWDASDLAERHPPRFATQRMLAILELRSPGPAQATGEVGVSRWGEMRPADCSGGRRLAVEPRPGGFPYGDDPPGEMLW